MMFVMSHHRILDAEGEGTLEVFWSDSCFPGTESDTHRTSSICPKGHVGEAEPVLEPTACDSLDLGFFLSVFFVPYYYVKRG